MEPGTLENWLADWEWASLSEALREVAEQSRHCTSDAGGRIPTWPLHEAALRLEALEHALKVIAANMEEYIDKNDGTVNVTIALAYETARAALSGDAL